MSQEEKNLAIEQYETLKRQRTGKKSSITKRVNQLHRLVSESGSRTKISVLHKALQDVHCATQDVCRRMASLRQPSDADIEWLNDVDHRVDDCSAEVLDYLDARKNDDASTNVSMTESWVNRHAPGIEDEEVLAYEDSLQHSAGLVEPHEIYPRAHETHILGASSEVQTGFSSTNTHQSEASPITQPQSSFGDLISSFSAFGFGENDQFTSWRTPRYMRLQDPPSLSTNTLQTVYSRPTRSDGPFSFRPSNILGQTSHDQPANSTSLGAQRSRCNTRYQPNMIFSTRQTNPVTRPQPAGVTPNEVDSWIDQLNESQVNQSRNLAAEGITTEVTMAWLVQQSLPRATIPTFDGSPLAWVPFITKFRDLVHKQAYLNDEQRIMYLLDHLDGEANRSVKGFAHDSRGYVMSLKRLKFLFGQKSKIAQANLQKVTRGKQVPDDDTNGLVEFFYTVSDCLVTLKQLNYESDLFSSDTLRQAVRRLPSKLHMKWAERCLRIREQHEEPNLVHFESWLQARVLAYKESYLPDRGNRSNNSSGNKSSISNDRKTPEVKQTLFGATIVKTHSSCSYCKGKHRIGKCERYSQLSATEKFDAVKRKKLCFNCLGEGHSFPVCPSKNTCFTPECSAKHHTSLHQFFAEKGNQSGNKEETVVHNAMVKSSSKDIYLQVVPIILHASCGQSIHTYALLDTGSQSTLLREDIARKLKLKGPRKALKISTVKDTAETVVVREVSLCVSSKDERFKTKIDSVYVVPADKFNMPGQPCPVGHEDSDLLTHLDGIEPNSINPQDITILIGANAPEALVTTEVRRGNMDQPLAVNTKFGWTLFGPSNNTSCRTSIFHLQTSSHPTSSEVRSSVEKLWSDHTSQNSTKVNTVLSITDQNLYHLVERFWKQEHCGILPESDVAPSVEDRQLQTKLDQETTFKDGHYYVPMLWKNPSLTLPNNFSMALKRFGFLKKRLRSNPELYKAYETIIKEYVEKGYARRMTREEAALTTSKTWYLPHHPVINPNKAGKIRVVKDAAAVFEGKSLNGSLNTGPDLLNSLVGIIIRFRTERVAIVADIESMFYQVRVTAEDIDSLRFLWSDNIYSDYDVYTLQMLVHIFGATDSPTCANYALKRTSRDNQHRFNSSTFLAVLRSFYMDDLLKSVKSEAIAIPLVKELVEMLQLGGFHLTKFLSNSKAVLDSLPPSKVSPSMTFDLDGENLQRALGISWDVSADRFTFSLNLPDAPQSKRGILRVTNSLFDPPGFITPFILPAKLLLQELWRKGYDWDVTIDEEAAKFWDNWLRNAKNLKQIKIDRCYNLLDEPVSEIQLHIFTDASEAAYGTVAYIRFSYKNGFHKCHLVMSKSKLAPIKFVTLAKLELDGCVSGTRLYKTIINEIDMPIERAYFWTDSTLALQYITNKEHRFKTYVANRVTEITDTISPVQWRHIPGDQNPADLLTRGVKDPSQLMKPDSKGNSWFSGPAFLQQDEEYWPKSPIGHLGNDDPEIKRKSVLVCLGFLQQDDNNAEKLSAWTKFSNWTKMSRVFGWVQRFITNCRSIQKNRTSGNLSCTEIDKSERQILKLVQRETFSEELHALEDGKPFKRHCKISSLSPFLDGCGILRIGGRLNNAPIPSTARNQIILPKNHPVTNVIIMQAHQKCGHLGASHVLADLREKFWVVNGRAAVKYATRNCFFCKIKRARQQYPFMADLPKGRVAYKDPPFSHCGVDLFGPLYIKQGRKRLKRWCVLFTCLTVRAIHLDVVESIDSHDFINCMRRFVNRRGCPKAMYSDCGTNFIGATTELGDAIEQLDRERIKEFATQERILWKFNPPSAPHMGGAWERLVRSVKEVMTGLMKDKVLSDAQLYTLLTEVENILNRRPLTTISDDIEDLEVLTPNHILIGMHRNWDYACKTEKKDVTSRNKYRQVQAIADQFWERWRREYLPTLTKRERWRDQTKNCEVGDLVILVDEKVRRGKWLLGRITKVMSGQDDVVRVVEIRTKTGKYIRPVTKLCRIEEDDVPQGEGC